MKTRAQFLSLIGLLLLPNVAFTQGNVEPAKRTRAAMDRGIAYVRILVPIVSDDITIDEVRTTLGDKIREHAPMLGIIQDRDDSNCKTLEVVTDNAFVASILEGLTSLLDIAGAKIEAVEILRSTPFITLPLSNEKMTPQGNALLERTRDR